MERHRGRSLQIWITGSKGLGPNEATLHALRRDLRWFVLAGDSGPPAAGAGPALGVAPGFGEEGPSIVARGQNSLGRETPLERHHRRDRNGYKHGAQGGRIEGCLAGVGAERRTAVDRIRPIWHG